MVSETRYYEIKAEVLAPMVGSFRRIGRNGACSCRARIEIMIFNSESVLINRVYSVTLELVRFHLNPLFIPFSPSYYVNEILLLVFLTFGVEISLSGMIYRRARY